LNIFIAYRTELAEGSEVLHSRLRADYNAGKPEVLAAVKEWAQLTESCRKALISGNLAEIPALINRNFDLRLKVCADSISEGNLRMVQIARSCGASAKFTGSGGAIVGTCDDAGLVEMKEKFKEFGVVVFRPEIVTAGGEAWRTLQ
jgi:glucuronokinase